MAEPPPLRDPLSEFASEVSGLGESNRLTEPVTPIGATAARSVSPATRRVWRGDWFTGALLLGVGLVAGFGGGVALTSHYNGGQDASLRSLVLSRADPGLPRPEVQPPTNRPAADPVAPIPPATNGLPPMTEADTNAPEPEPLIPRQTPSVAPVEAIQEGSAALLYVQSSPAGAEVYLDGQLVTTTPFQLSEITPGQHTIRIELQGYRTWSSLISVEPGARIRIAAALER